MKYLNVFIPLFCILGLALFSASIWGANCFPPATCAGTQLGVLESLHALIANPISGFMGFAMILGMLTLSWVFGIVVTLLIYIGLFVWLTIGIKQFRRS